MIVLFGMYGYEFFISSAISDVPEVWLAMLLIALDLAENFFHIYCIYQAEDPSSSLGGVSRVSLEDPKPDSQRVEGDNEGQPDEAAPALLPPTDHEHPANDLQTSDSHPDAVIEPPLPQSTALQTGFPLSASDERNGGACLIADREGNSVKTHLDALQCPDQLEPDVLYGRGGSHPKTLEPSSDAQCSDFLRIMPSVDGNATVNPDHGRVTAGRKREIAARLSYSSERRGIDRRGSSMSTLSSFTSLLKHTIGYARQGLVEGTLDGVSLASDGNGLVNGSFPIDDAQTIVRRTSHKGSLPSRRSSVLEMITEVIIGRSKGKSAEKLSKRSLSVMTIAICEEMVEILAPLHFLISSCFLRTFNPKLHDTFWDMTDEEFARSIRRLLIDIVAEACLFILFIIAMKRRFDESIVFIALRLGHHFLWPFLTVQVSLMTYYILLQYSNAGMTFAGDFMWVGEKNVTWHGGNCYTRRSETVDEVC
ncbi:hypothetical protein FOZ63_019267 [Perkinsus olseni]|uniref:Uncharacterized protein n=1 Tax=Perkinsus olseni TaxID=32597 RepID=A0A7J6TSZ0_PEROL|nr:hypothetical protein FOZ63_019267 [Perkinsus olseni]